MKYERPVPESEPLTSLLARYIRTKLNLFRRILIVSIPGIVEYDDPSVPSVAREPGASVKKLFTAVSYEFS
jgi:hypothetical protein